MNDTPAAADHLIQLYDMEFGGKPRGRYRISGKHLRLLYGRKRLYADDIHELEREMYERGFILIDMESFYIVLSQKTFANYRRANESCLPSREG